MFTGIIETLGEIKKITKGDNVWRWQVSAPKEYSALAIGSSVACSGACLTIVEKDKDGFVVEITTETQTRTNFNKLKEGSKINLERAMSLGGSIDGHIITGHIDGLAEIVSIAKNGDETGLALKAPPGLMKYIAAKGSVALDGVSLTVNETKEHSFTLMLIPHTIEVLNWHGLEKGYCFNLEIDLLSRYAVNYLERKTS
jgi:riboflavin synthase